jgi:hypothetical protein
MPPASPSRMLFSGPAGHTARAERERRIDMGIVVLAWSSLRAATRTTGSERGATAVEYLMVLALCLAAAVLVASLGAALTADVT